jgi:arylsulfatase A-like enzyme
VDPGARIEPSSRLAPDLVYDNHNITPPATPEEGYHLSKDLADKAIEFIGDAHSITADKPFFMYFCPGAGHAPHHIFKEEADKYKGKFDMGWDEYREMVFARSHPRRRSGRTEAAGKAVASQETSEEARDDSSVQRQDRHRLTVLLVRRPQPGEAFATGLVHMAGESSIVINRTCVSRGRPAGP